MQKLLFISVTVIGAAIAVWVVLAMRAAEPPREGAMAQFTPNDPPRPAPETPFETVAGEPVTLTVFKDKVVLVNFWATWCAPCVREMPSLDRLQASFDKDRFVILAVSVDRDGAEKVTPFFEKHGIKNLTPLLDRRMRLAGAFGVPGMPTSYLLDRSGRIVGNLPGVAEWDSPEAKALVRFYLEKG